MIQGNIGLYTNIKIRRFDENWNLISENSYHNLVPTTGLDLMVNHLLSSKAATSLWPHHFVLGTGTTPAYSTDNALQTSAYNAALTAPTIRSAGVTFEGALYTTDSVGSTFHEMGLFTSSSEMIARALIAPLIKTSSNPTNELFSWAFDFTAST